MTMSGRPEPWGGSTSVFGTTRMSLAPPTGRYFILDRRSLRYFTHPDTPIAAYPEGFQGTSIPVHGPTVAKLLEDRLDGKLF